MSDRTMPPCSKEQCWVRVADGDLSLASESLFGQYCNVRPCRGSGYLKHCTPRRGDECERAESKETGARSSKATCREGNRRGDRRGEC